MPYYIYQVSPKGFFLLDEKGRMYNKKPQSLQKCQNQRKAIEVNKHSKSRNLNKIKGGGGVMSHFLEEDDPLLKWIKDNVSVEAFAWLFFPPEIEICEIRNVDWIKLIRFAEDSLVPILPNHSGLAGATRVDTSIEDSKIFMFKASENPSTDILKAPFRILLTTTTGSIGAIAIRDKEDFITLVEQIGKLTKDPLSDVGDPYIVSQPRKVPLPPNGTVEMEMPKPEYLVKRRRFNTKVEQSAQTEAPSDPRLTGATGTTPSQYGAVGHDSRGQTDRRSHGTAQQTPSVSYRYPSTPSTPRLKKFQHPDAPQTE